MADERVFNVSLTNAHRKARSNCASYAVLELKGFIARHMKSDVDSVKLSNALNSHIWSRGIEKPPRNVKVRAVKEEEKVNVTLPDEKKLLEKVSSKEPKSEKKEEPKKETKLVEKKPEAKEEAKPAEEKKEPEKTEEEKKVEEKRKEPAPQEKKEPKEAEVKKAGVGKTDKALDQKHEKGR